MPERPPPIQQGLGGRVVEKKMGLGAQEDDLEECCSLGLLAAPSVLEDGCGGCQGVRTTF